MAYFHRTHRPAECVAHCQALLLDAGVLQSTLPVYFHLIWTNSLPSSTRPCFPGPAVPSSTGRVGWLKRRRKSLHERIGSGAFPTPRIGSLSLSTTPLGWRVWTMDLEQSSISSRIYKLGSLSVRLVTIRCFTSMILGEARSANGF